MRGVGRFERMSREELQKQLIDLDQYTQQLKQQLVGAEEEKGLLNKRRHEQAATIQRLEQDLARATRQTEIDINNKDLMKLKKELAEKNKKIEILDKAIVEFRGKITKYEIAADNFMDKDKET